LSDAPVSTLYPSSPVSPSSRPAIYQEAPTVWRERYKENSKRTYLQFTHQLLRAHIEQFYLAVLSPSLSPQTSVASARS
jgi:hypothetical protein